VLRRWRSRCWSPGVGNRLRVSALLEIFERVLRRVDHAYLRVGKRAKRLEFLLRLGRAPGAGERCEESISDPSVIRRDCSGPSKRPDRVVWASGFAQREPQVIPGIGVGGVLFGHWLKIADGRVVPRGILMHEPEDEVRAAIAGTIAKHTLERRSGSL